MRPPSFEQVLDILERHERDARRVINMVPSENSMSPLAKLPLLLDVYHRYFFNVAEADDGWAFRGSQDVACLETGLTLELLRDFTRARFVNPRPLSGLSGMAMVLSALGGERGATVLSVSPDQGGHYATAALVGRLGFASAFMTGRDAHSIDFDQVAAALRAHRPRLVYVDQSNCLFPLDVRALVETTRRVAPDTLVHVDCSHWMGLVLGQQFPNPLDLGADSFGGSTHKTFPGPQKAIVVTNREDINAALSKAQFEMISSHHFAGTISLGLALLEFRDCGGDRYAAEIVTNAKRLGARLSAVGLHVEARERGFTAGHQLWIRTQPNGIDAYAASDRLFAAGIRVNAFPDLPAISERVIRIGVNEATYHGLRGEDIDELGDVFADAVRERRPASALAERVAALRARYHAPYSFPVTDGDRLARVWRLFTTAMSPSIAPLPLEGMLPQ